MFPHTGNAMKFDPLFLFQANSPEDIPPVIATGFSYLISIFRNDLFFVSVVENEGLYQGFDNYLLQRDKFLVRIFKGIWQYKLSLSYLKEHSKLYINFLYNNSVSCLGFEIDRLILIKSSVHSAIYAFDTHTSQGG